MSPAPRRDEIRPLEDLPGYAEALVPFVERDLKGSRIYNASLAQDAHGKLLMVYRSEDRRGHSSLWMARLKPRSRKTFECWELLRDETRQTHFEDPRLALVGGKLILTYVAVKLRGRVSAVMHVATLHPETLDIVHDVVPDLGDNGRRIEKNWTVFDYHGDPMIHYAPNPHRVARLGNEAQQWTNPFAQWPWHRLSGGTPPMLWPGRGMYLAFLHGFVEDRKVGRRYFLSAMTFEKEPPFAPVALTHPLVWGSEENLTICNPRDRRWNPAVVFPCGAVREDKAASWLLSLGVNDSYIAFLRMSDAELHDTLIDWHSFARGEQEACRDVARLDRDISSATRDGSWKGAW